MNMVNAQPLQAESTIDPITFEVIRHKLEAITEEQAITLRAVSGSPVVTDATDFNCGLYLPNGDIVVAGRQVLPHAGTMSTVIKSIIETCSDNPGIKAGDMFVLNDPYRGAIHQPDVSIVAPIFHDGRRIAWAGMCAHQLDMGGVAFGSWAYSATEIQQEALLLPGVKLVEGGEIRNDIWQMIMGMSRLPHVIGLDFKGMIAANNVAIKRFNELLDRYGVETVEEVLRLELRNSERMLRERLLQIPDGIYRGRDYCDHDGHANRLYEVCVTIEKRGDEMIWDLSGSSPQSPGYINSTYTGTRGALFSAMLPILAPDLRWNEGLMGAVTIRNEEGLITNARWPAPVSGATVEISWIALNAAVQALSRMAAMTPERVSEGQGVTKGQFSVMTMGGLDRDGSPYGNFFMDSMAGGGGAFIDHDGLDGGGDFFVPRSQIPNVESLEAGGPVLYLYRKFLPDTAGAGRMRGGGTLGMAVTLHDTEGVHAMVLGHGIEVPNSAGQFGGMPGSCAYHLLKQGGPQTGPAEMLGDVRSPDELIAKGENLGARPGAIEVHRGDIIGYSFQGGGGYGDPLRRDPAQVVKDVTDNFVTVGAAADYYGVVIVNGDVDAAATEAKRKELRAARLGGKAPAKAPPVVNDGLPDLRIGEGKSLRCACGCRMAAPGEDWKARAVSREVKPANAGRHIHLHKDLTMREFACPDCATLLEVEVLRKDEKPLPSLLLFA